MVGLNFPSVLISVLSDAGSILLPYRVAWYVGSQGELKQMLSSKARLYFITCQVLKMVLLYSY